MGLFTLYGVEFEEWLTIRDERDRMADALKRIAASDGRTKHERLRQLAARAVYPDKPYAVARLLCKQPRYIGNRRKGTTK